MLLNLVLFVEFGFYAFCNAVVFAHYNDYEDCFDDMIFLGKIFYAPAILLNAICR